MHNTKISEIMLLGVLCIGKFKTIACGSYVDSVSVPRNQQRCQIPCHRKFSTSVSMQHQTATLLLCLSIPLLAWSTAFHIVFFKFDPTA